EVHYGTFRAVRDVTLGIREHEITAFIGPSGCGKTTILRCLNRMNDLVPGARVEGTILYHDHDLYGAGVDPVEVRGLKDDLDGRVESALKQAALWDEVKTRLKRSALGLSGGQQQRLCIARA